ncbi:angiotensin-converting enzyme-like [Macrosteles quadrilineatus]|nr:angiotensin-converting enzyme-like [Macrosteles quadrilineatus]
MASDETDIQKDLEILLLLKTALNKVPQIVFGMMMDKWRWKVMRGEVTPQEYNTEWWSMHKEFLRVSPPVQRSKADFDPAAKFHIMDNTPYIRYFLSGFLQMQFFESLCLATIPRQAKLPFPLHRCDIYGNKEAGRLLRNMMRLGSRAEPQEALATMTEGRYISYSAKPFLEYFRPLSLWLDSKLTNASPI